MIYMPSIQSYSELTYEADVKELIMTFNLIVDFESVIHIEI